MMIYRKQAEMRSLLKVLLLASLLSAGVVAATGAIPTCGDMVGKTFTVDGSDVNFADGETSTQVATLDPSHVLCSVTKTGETEVKLYKLKIDEASLYLALTNVDP